VSGAGSDGTQSVPPVFRRNFQEQTHGTKDHAVMATERERSAMAKDPVCKMDVEESKAAATAAYQGKTYYFCAVGCKQKFEKNPEQYVGKS
jgi:YHS domain-containing protein